MAGVRYVGASRVYATLLGERIRRSTKGRAALLGFLAMCLRSVNPAPEQVRELTRQIMRGALAYRGPAPADRLLDPRDPWASPVNRLIRQHGFPLTAAMDEIELSAGVAIVSGDLPAQVRALRVAMPIQDDRCRDLLHRHAVTAIAAAQTDAFIRHTSLELGLITCAQALAMPGGLTVLCRDSYGVQFGWAPFLRKGIDALLHGQSTRQPWRRSPEPGTHSRERTLRRRRQVEH